MESSEPLDYLVIAAHPDDAELSVGGTILALKAEGARVGILDLTNGEPTPFGSPEIRQRETQAATALLGVDWRGNLGLPNRELVADLEARRQLAGMIRQLRPRVLLAHYWEDAHPDHVAASALTDAARFWAKLSKTDLPGEPCYPARIFYFLSIHLRLHIAPSFVLDVSAHHQRKMQALECYYSQLVQGCGYERKKRGRRRPFSTTSATGPAIGSWTIGTSHGEPFVCREEVGLRSLRDLNY